MRIADAIRAGIPYGPQIYGDTTRYLDGGRVIATCAWGSAVLGAHINSLQRGVEEHGWGWVFKVYPIHPANLEDYVVRTVNTMIIHLNDSRHWTREQIADWLDTIDPTPRYSVPAIREEVMPICFEEEVIVAAAQETDATELELVCA